MYIGATTLQTFRTKYVIDDSGCWLWIGRKSPDGYGRFNHTLAHRIAYRLLVGEIPQGLCVCHRCDVRDCVNPGHLFLGSHQENMADMLSKGRRADTHGGRNPRAKLTAADVRSIRADQRRADEIAKDFGVVAGAIYNIRAGRAWSQPE